MTDERHEKALEAAEWIKHDGQGQPVSGDLPVIVKLEHGEIIGPYKAKEYHWHWIKRHGDIMAYSLAPNHFTNGE